MRCTKRIEYVAALEGRSASMPVEMTDMARWTDEQVQYLKENFESKTDSQLAEAIGKNGGAVCVKRLGLGLKKAASWRSGWERIKERKAAMKQADADIDRLPKDEPEGIFPIHRTSDGKIHVGEAPRDPDPPAAPSALELVPVARPDFTLINFKKYEAIYGRLQAAAERDFRTPELQALFYISQALERENGAPDQRRAADFAR